MRAGGELESRFVDTQRSGTLPSSYRQRLSRWTELRKIPGAVRLAMVKHRNLMQIYHVHAYLLRPSSRILVTAAARVPVVRPLIHIHSEMSVTFQSLIHLKVVILGRPYWICESTQLANLTSVTSATVPQQSKNSTTRKERYV